MDVIEAIKTRRSIRGYKGDPIPKQVMTELLEVARLAPSGLNEQPWEFVVLTGDVLRAVKDANLGQFLKGAEPHPAMGCPRLTGEYYRRRIDLAKGLYGILGIPREDKEGRRGWLKLLNRFYEAPAVILVCADKEAPYPRCIFNIGVVSQTICLAALQFGLGTCMIEEPVNFPELTRQIAGIPESKIIYIGIAMGYPDWDLPANRFRSTRDPLNGLVTWRESLF